MKTDLGKGKMRSICSLPKTKVTVKGRPFSLSHVSSLVHRGDNFPILGEGRCRLPLHASVLPTEDETDTMDQRSTPTAPAFTEGRGEGASEAGPTVLHVPFAHISDISLLLSPVGLWVSAAGYVTQVRPDIHEELEPLLSLRPCSHLRVNQRLCFGGV